jgi:hypothetical protein
MKRLLLFVLILTFAAPMVVNAQYFTYNYNRRHSRHHQMMLTGIKLNLDLIPKSEQKLVRHGIITVDGGEVGVVDRFDGFWNGILRLCPGSHQVMVELEDGRVFQTQINLLPGQVHLVYVRFWKPRTENQTSAQK